jgi:hypothetical protein
VDISEGVLRLTVNFQRKSPAEMSTLTGLPCGAILYKCISEQVGGMAESGAEA